MPKRMSSWFKMNEEISVETPLQGKRAAMDNRMRFKEHHVARIESDVVSLPVVVIYLQWPLFIHILRNVNHGRGHKRKSIHMGKKNSIFLVNAYAIEGCRTKIFSGPVFDCLASGIPKFLPELTSPSSQFPVFDSKHVRRIDPCIDIRIAGGPRFRFHIVMILIPKFGRQFNHSLWCTDFLESNICIVLHTLGLPHVHQHAVVFVDVALTPLFAIE
mmetsp:Transcript_676/g.1049  ORF Transcript_676/g.1049 Transcript_676/m.1049 type:complete len:216 (+) Transcript_676:678-1325(+)